MQTLTSIPHKSIIIVQPEFYSTKCVCNGDAPDGVYRANAQGYTAYMVVLNKKIGDCIRDGIRVGVPATAILNYHPDSNTLLPGTPQPGCTWEYLPGIKVVFDLTNI